MPSTNHNQEAINRYEIRAAVLNEDEDRKIIQSKSSLLTHFKGRYYKLFGTGGSHPDLPPEHYERFNHILLVEEDQSRDSIQIKVLDIISAPKGKDESYQ